MSSLVDVKTAQFAERGVQTGNGKLVRMKHLEKLIGRSQPNDAKVLHIEHSPPTTKKFLQRLEQIAGQVAERESPQCFDQPEDEQSVSFQTGWSSLGSASSDALEVVPEAIAEEATQRSAVAPRKKGRLNNRRRRERWIRQRREMLMEATHVQAEEHHTSATQQSPDIEHRVSIAGSSSSWQGPCTSGPSGADTANISGECWAAGATLLTQLSL